MNKMLLAAACAALTLQCQAGIASDDQVRDHDWRPPQIEGVWTLQVTLRDCATGEVAPVPNPVFPALDTFHQGGTMTEGGSRTSPATRSPGQGIWKRTGRRTFEARNMFQRFDVNGFFTGTQDVKLSITLSRDGTSLSVSTTATFIDASGVVTPAGCSTQVGQRVEI